MQKSGYDRLPDLQRYLQAVDKRIDKLAQDVNRDRAAMLTRGTSTTGLPTIAR